MANQLNRDAQVSNWEKHLASIIDQTNTNLSYLSKTNQSSSNNGGANKIYVPPPPLPPPPTGEYHQAATRTAARNMQAAPNVTLPMSPDYYQRQAREVISASRGNTVRRPHAEENLTRRIKDSVKKTVEHVMTKRENVNQARVDRLKDDLENVSKDNAKIRKEYGMLSRSVTSQDRLSKRLKDEWEKQRIIVKKLEMTMTQDIAWKEATKIDLEVLKKQQTQDNALRVTGNELRSAMETIVAKTMAAVDRSTSAAKGSFESEISLLKQDIDILKGENKILREELAASNESSRRFMSKFDENHVKSVIANAVQNHLGKVEAKITASARTVIGADIKASEEKINGGILEKLKDCLGREVIHGGGDFYSVIYNVAEKVAVEREKFIVDKVLASVHSQNAGLNSLVKVQVDEVREYLSRKMKADIENVLKTNEATSKVDYEIVKKMISTKLDDTARDVLKIHSEPQNEADIRSLESKFDHIVEQVQDLCGRKESRDEVHNNIQEEIQKISEINLKTEQKMSGLSDDISLIYKAIDMKTRQIERESRSYTEQIFKGLPQTIASQIGEISQHLDEDVSTIHLKIDSQRKEFVILKNDVRGIQTSENYASDCLKDLVREKVAELRGEFGDIQDNVIAINTASRERIDLLVEEVRKEIALVKDSTRTLFTIKEENDSMTNNSSTSDASEAISKMENSVSRIFEDLKRQQSLLWSLKTEVENINVQLSQGRLLNENLDTGISSTSLHPINNSHISNGTSAKKRKSKSLEAVSKTIEEFQGKDDCEKVSINEEQIPNTAPKDELCKDFHLKTLRAPYEMNINKSTPKPSAFKGNHLLTLTTSKGSQILKSSPEHEHCEKSHCFAPAGSSKNQILASAPIYNRLSTQAASSEDQSLGSTHKTEAFKGDRSSIQTEALKGDHSSIQTASNEDQNLGSAPKTEAFKGEPSLIQKVSSEDQSLGSTPANDTFEGDRSSTQGASNEGQILRSTPTTEISKGDPSLTKLVVGIEQRSKGSTPESEDSKKDRSSTLEVSPPFSISESIEGNVRFFDEIEIVRISDTKAPPNGNNENSILDPVITSSSVGESYDTLNPGQSFEAADFGGRVEVQYNREDGMDAKIDEGMSSFEEESVASIEESINSSYDDDQCGENSNSSYENSFESEIESV